MKARLQRLLPTSMEGQMIGVVALALVGLLVVLILLELRAHDTAIEWANRPSTLDRVQKMLPVLESVDAAQIDHILEVASLCHSGFTVTRRPFAVHRTDEDTARLRARLARNLDSNEGTLSVGYALLTREDFSYRKCRHAEIDLPIEGVVISVQLSDGRWFNTEVHPHEWHISDIIDWLGRSGAAFVFVGGVAIFFMRRLGRPLRSLTDAAVRFGRGLSVVAVEERGPPDLRRAIRAFNAMQHQVSSEVQRRTHTLAAISHDIRTPLTALRIRTELIDDADARKDLIGDIQRMEAVTASALAYLRGESNGEAMRKIDLCALVESECDDFEQLGHRVRFDGSGSLNYRCRSDAMARAVRNLIDNAVKYAGGADVTVRRGDDSIDIVVADQGQGIAEDERERAAEPFERLSARTSRQATGFGLGLTVVKAIAEGHGGDLILESNEPKGLAATIRLPL